ncbi:FIG138056: a glutathione-dependent thiol reductase [hydrothermal vent metagenome]|uniref:FIG138056: a glutathione-dependent thiol reductase n=1 Tax=hydrothermal vent metagenome TaxID=652676 RepID=A0A3B0Z7C9_9ZZZZ
MIKFYGYKKCGTCRKAEKVLIENGAEYTFIDVTENPPTASALNKMVKQANVEHKKLFNTSGVQYRELKIKDKLSGLTGADIVQMLAENGRLIKRPLVTDGNSTTIGFKDDVFKAAWEISTK